jgi:hypothetical protein
MFTHHCFTCELKLLQKSAHDVPRIGKLFSLDRHVFDIVGIHCQGDVSRSRSYEAAAQRSLWKSAISIKK